MYFNFSPTVHCTDIHDVYLFRSHRAQMYSVRSYMLIAACCSVRAVLRPVFSGPVRFGWASVRECLLVLRFPSCATGLCAPAARRCGSVGPRHDALDGGQVREGGWALRARAFPVGRVGCTFRICRSFFCFLASRGGPRAWRIHIGLRSHFAQGSRHFAQASFAQANYGIASTDGN